VQSIQALFATDSVQAWWYVTRASGLTAYFLLWLSMLWGLVIPSKIFQSFMDGAFSYDFHEFLSLLGLGFVALHVIVLLFDKFLSFNILQILIPFIDSYRPFWVGLGILGFYFFLLVTVTFYLRKLIGSQAFRSIHTISLLGYLSATLHGLFAGTDSALPFTKILYAVTFLIILFFTVYWLVMGGLNKREQVQIEFERARAARKDRYKKVGTFTPASPKAVRRR
jgi:predicted ferric reductase